MSSYNVSSKVKVRSGWIFSDYVQTIAFEMFMMQQWQLHGIGIYDRNGVKITLENKIPLQTNIVVRMVQGSTHPIAK